MKQLIWMVLLLIGTTTALAQPRTRNGMVADREGRPVPGATVQAEGGKSLAAGADGRFTLSLENGRWITVTATGYESLRLQVGEQTELNITLTPAATAMETVSVGTRRTGRMRMETPVPVDVIATATLFNSGRTDLTSGLNVAAPSLNYNKQSGSDGADHVDLATLRGLAPDQTLVLVNGKRRHQSSFVSVFGTRGRGASGTDLNSIPLSSIDRVEILRDGASAQYGSDAIAGVINLVLKKTAGFSGTVGSAAYLDPKFNTAFRRSLGQYETVGKLDGRSFTAGLNYGMRVGRQGGFLNLSLDHLSSGKTTRQALDTTDPINNPEGMYLNPYRRGFGDGSLDMTGTGFNLELPARQAVIYSFGSFNHRYSDAFAFSRNFSMRPERFPTHADGTMIDYPGIIRTTPDGESFYNPHIQTRTQDLSWSAGVRGKGAWKPDLSHTIGYNRFHFFVDRTFNASKGVGQTRFDAGGFNLLQHSTNLNVSHELKGFAYGGNLAAGAEFRHERYGISSGEEASYTNYDPSGEKAGGAQGFPGYQPADAVRARRSTLAAYVDAEVDLNANWLVSGAVRAERYSDFGFTHNYKLATRIKMAKNLSLRGSASTGFRAPSLQQLNFSSTFTTIQGGLISEVKIAPNYSALARAAGIPELKQERSINAGLGLTWKPLPQLNLSVDGYWVRVKDRVVLTGQFDGADPDLDPALAAKMDELQVGLAQFFANAVNTTNRGVDVVAEFNRRTGNRRLKFLLAGNVQGMTIDRIHIPSALAGSDFLRNTFFSQREQSFLLASAPRVKATINGEYGWKKVAVGARATLFGKQTLLGYGEDGLGIDPKVPSDGDGTVYVRDEFHYAARVVSDVYVKIQLKPRISLITGADNLFNVHPSLGVARGAKGWAYNNEPAGPFDTVQMGGNGRRLFTRIAFKF